MMNGIHGADGARPYQWGQSTKQPPTGSLCMGIIVFLHDVEVDVVPAMRGRADVVRIQRVLIEAIVSLPSQRSSRALT